MAKLRIIKEGEAIEFRIDGEKRAELSLNTQASIAEIIELITRTLQWLPKELEMTREWVIELVKILIPELWERLNIQMNSQEQARDRL